MKSIIVSVLSALVAVVGIAAPAGATNNGGFYLTGNAGFSNSGWSRMGIKDGKFYIEGENVMCFKMNSVMGGSMTTGNAQTPAQTQAVLPSANTDSCEAEQVVTNPPANSTITINGICGTPEEIAKIKAQNANLIINSVGPCPTDGTKPTTPTTIVVTEKTPPVVVKASTTTPTAAPAANNGPVDLPETGLSDIGLITGGIAALVYGTTLAVRAFRARA